MLNVIIALVPVLAVAVFFTILVISYLSIQSSEKVSDDDLIGLDGLS